MSNSVDVEVMATSHAKVKESQPGDYVIRVALRITMAKGGQEKDKGVGAKAKV